jgi:hypothetical protein
MLYLDFKFENYNFYKNMKLEIWIKFNLETEFLFYFMALKYTLNQSNLITKKYNYNHMNQMKVLKY